MVLGCGSLAAAWWRQQLGGDKLWWRQKRHGGGSNNSSLTAAAGPQREWDICSGDGSATAQRWWCSAQAAQRWQLCRCSSAAFVLGQGRRDDGADSAVVGDSGARGDVHRGRRGTDYAKGCADDIIC